MSMSIQIADIHKEIEHSRFELQNRLATTKNLDTTSEQLSKLSGVINLLKVVKSNLNEVENSIFKDYLPVLEFIQKSYYARSNQAFIKQQVLFEDIFYAFNFRMEELQNYLNLIVLQGKVLHNKENNSYYMKE